MQPSKFQNIKQPNKHLIKQLDVNDIKVKNNNKNQSKQSQSFSNEQQFQRILNQEHNGKKKDGYTKNHQIVLTFKVQQLQRMCKNLSQTNKKLLKKIQDLQNGNQTSSHFIDEFSQMQSQFSQIQQLLRQYRGNLERYQQQLSKQVHQKNITIIQLKEQLRNVIEINASISQQNMQLLQINHNLQITNQQLRLNISRLQIIVDTNRTPRKSLRSGSNIGANNQYHTKRQSYYDRIYDPQIREIQRRQYYQSVAQQQLEILIERLVEELEHQKRIKKKMNEQIKRMSRQLIQSEKQLMEKNNKIYLLQLNVIKNGRVIKISKSAENLNQHCNFIQQKQINKLPQSFTLMDLLNGDVKISQIAKLQISRKILKLFQRKFEIKQFSEVMIEDLEIVNFSQRNLNIFGVRQLCKRRADNRQQVKNQDIVWNLAFILDNLLNQVPQYKQSINEQIREIKQEILQIVELILDNRLLSDDPFLQIKKILDKATKSTL